MAHVPRLSNPTDFAFHPSASISANPVYPLPQPASNSSTVLMASVSASPAPRSRRDNRNDNYKPKIVTTVGAKPACLVNASVTYVGNDQIYAFGGFDQYTDEVYNHVLRLNLTTRQWNLVDNFGDIPGVRMGHTANLWKGNKLLIYGGENEHRAYLSDVILFDLETAHWTQPELNGPTPRGRARHSAVIHDDKLFVIGGMTGSENYILDDICYLDLKTWTWSRSWRFVPRYDHTTWIYDGRVWVFGGLGEEMERTSEIWWLDIRGNPGFESAMSYGTNNRGVLARSRESNATGWRMPVGATGSTGYAANSSSVQVNPVNVMNRSTPVAPGAISSLKFVASQNLPPQAIGTHFHVFSSGCLLDFVTPASVISSCDISLSSLDLDTLRWQKMADGKDLFPPSYRWHYCTLDEDGTKAWLLGCPTDGTVNDNAASEYLSDVLPIDLSKFGLMGNKLSAENRAEQTKMPASDANTNSYLSGIGADLAKTFDQPPETGSGADFIITGEREEDVDFGDDASTVAGDASFAASASQPIHVHAMILQARWTHFQRMWNSQMIEYQTKRLHIPEPYSAVRAFLFYLYTDSIKPHPVSGPTLNDVAGMLVMANLYDMPRLRVLCVNRLSKELDVEHAAIIWERASTAGEGWLKKRAADFCMMYWGRVVRTQAFRNLPRRSLLELCEEIDAEGRVLGGDELEMIGGLGGTRLSGSRDARKRSLSTLGMVGGEEVDDVDDGEDEGMELS